MDRRKPATTAAQVLWRLSQSNRWVLPFSRARKRPAPLQRSTYRSSGAPINRHWPQRVRAEAAPRYKRRSTSGAEVMAAPRRSKDGIHQVWPWLLRPCHVQLVCGFQANKWMRRGRVIPTQIAEKLVGRSFPSFRALREAVSQAVATTPELAQPFNEFNQRRMSHGNAPFAPEPEIGERRGVWELHHDPRIGLGGEVYDLSTTGENSDDTGRHL